jgi:hypothetical protein
LSACGVDHEPDDSDRGGHAAEVQLIPKAYSRTPLRPMRRQWSYRGNITYACILRAADAIIEWVTFR